MPGHEKSPEMKDATCTLCDELAQVDRAWEVTWSLDCASSVHDLVDLYDLSFFVEATYCPTCKELVRDIHFMTNSVAVLKHRLDLAKAKVTQMLQTDKDTDASVTGSAVAEEGSGEEWLEGEFECGYSGCGAFFPTKHGLFEHNQTHSEDNVDLSCSVEGCGKSFGRKSHLSRHLRNVHSVEERRADKARVTGKLEKNSGSALNLSDENVFHCKEKECGRFFGRRSHLTRHLRNVHSTDDEPWRPRRHTETVGKEKIWNSITSEKVCSVVGCGKRFGRASHLTRHLKNVHAANKTHKATFSDTFKAKYGTDLTVIDDESAFACSEEGCGKVFGRKSHLTRHLQNVHYVRRATPMRDSETRSKHNLQHLPT